MELKKLKKNFNTKIDRIIKKDIKLENEIKRLRRRLKK